MSVPELHPEIEAIKSRTVKLREQLRCVLQESHRLSTEERPRLNALYHSLFGQLEHLLQDRTLKSAEIRRRVELLRVKFERGERLSKEVIDLINVVVNREFARFKRRVQEAFQMDDSDRQRNANGTHNGAAESELVNMYRVLAKKLHPDAAGESIHTVADWHHVQELYRKRNVAQLRSIITALGADEVSNAVTQNWDLQSWEREVNAIELRLGAEERKLQRMLQDEPFKLSHKIDDSEWHQQHRSSLLKLIEDKEREILDATIQYEQLTGGYLEDSHNPDSDEGQQKFRSDFMDSTYFGQR